MDRAARRGAGPSNQARRIVEDRLEGQLGGTEQRRVDAERRRHDLDERPRRGEGPPVELALDRSRRRTGGGGRSCPPSTTRAGLSVLTRPASPIPSHRPTSARAASAVASPAAASARTASTAALPPSAGRPARTQQRLLADLRLPAADRAAPARGAGERVDRACARPRRRSRRRPVSGRPPTMIPPPTPTSPDRKIDVVGAGRGAAAMLGEGAEVGLVGDRDRRRRAERLGRAPAERRRRASRGSAPSTRSRRRGGRRRRRRRRSRRARRCATTAPTPSASSTQVGDDVLRR